MCSHFNHIWNNGVLYQPPPWQYFCDCIILAVRNEDIHMLNRRILCLLCGNHQLYTSANTHSFEPGAEQHEQDISVEFLHSLNASGLPLAHLKLKEGCPIILLHNLDSKQGLGNGTRATIIRMSHCILEVCLIGGNHNGKLALIPQITLSPSIQGFNFSINLKRRQFPVQLTFAMTINKSQGQSVSHVGINLWVPAFLHGQLYIALLHATSPSCVKVLLPGDTAGSYTANIVFPEILID
jgi:ATP-dependent DNA helicase PIF1